MSHTGTTEWKTSCFVGKWNPKHTYTMGGENLTVTTEEKDLGVIFDEKLEFDKHIRIMDKT